MVDVFKRKMPPPQPPTQAGRIECRATVVVPGPPELAWQVIEAPQLALEDPDVVEADWVGTQRGVGGKQAFVRRNPDGTTTASVVQILEWDPPRRAVLTTISGTLAGFTTGACFELADLGDGHTRVVHTNWQDYPAGGRPEVLERMRELLQDSTDKLAQQVLTAVTRRTSPPAA